MEQKVKIVKHKVEIREILRKVVEIELPEDCNKSPKEVAQEKYAKEHDGYVLSADDYYDTEFIYLGKAD